MIAKLLFFIDENLCLSGGQKKGNIAPFYKKGRKGDQEIYGVGASPLWESHGTNPPGKHVEAHDG